MKLWLFLAVIMCMLCPGDLAGREEQGLEEGRDAPSIEQRAEALKYMKEIRDRREAAIEILSAILRDYENQSKQGGHPLSTAIYTLGELRAADASDELIVLIDFIPEEMPSNLARSRLSRYLAAEALIKIGLPSVKFLIVKIRIEQDDRRRDIAAWIVRRILGQREAVARLEDSRPRNLPAEQQRIDEAIEFILSYEPAFESLPGN